MTPSQPVTFVSDASRVLAGIEHALNRAGYTPDPQLRSHVRNHCIRRAIEEILLIDRIQAPPYLDYAYQLVKQFYVRFEHDHTNALLEDVNQYCLHHCIRTSSLGENPNFDVRGKWFVTAVI